MTQNSDNLHTLNIPSDLHLENTNLNAKFNNNAVVPDELNEYLRSQLQHMKHENETLQQDILKKDSVIKRNQAKIQELSTKLKEYEGYCDNEYASASQVANSKIAELCRKLREKNCEIEIHKSKCSKLENSLSELQKQSENAEQIDKKEPEVIQEPNELKKLQDKLSHITNKWTEEKNQNLQLKNDLKKASKWLQQEVGDKFETLLALNNSSSNWRGRAQVICDLQQKNQELKEKLKGFEEKGSGVPNHEPAYSNKHEKKAELLTKENLELKNHYDDVKRKYEAIKARCKVLETDCTILKSKLSNLNKTFDNDQEMIAKLNSQISFLNQQKSDDAKHKEGLVKKLQLENESLKIELTKERCLCENKSKELLEKEEDIQILNKKVRNSRPPSSYVHKHDNAEAKAFGKLEVERLRLLELTQLQNAHLQDERNAHLKTQHILRCEKQKNAKLEASIARLQLEQNSARSTYSNKSNSSKQSESDIRDKLELAEENIKALTTRLELEILERKHNIQEFSNILKNYDYKTILK